MRLTFNDTKVVFYKFILLLKNCMHNYTYIHTAYKEKIFLMLSTLVFQIAIDSVLVRTM